MPPPGVPPAGSPQYPPAFGGPMYGSYTLASWGSRVGAAVLDWLFAVIGITALIVAAGAAKADAAGIFIGWLLVFLLSYPLAMMRQGEHNGQTLGKQVVGIRVIRHTGQPMAYGWAVLREFVVKYLLFVVIGAITGWIAWLLDILWPLWDAENRALHDMVASTHIVCG